MLDPMDKKSNGGTACPESTIDSAFNRGPSNGPDKKHEGIGLSCESTIESASRRDLLKRATLIGATAAIGGTILGGKIIPKSTGANGSPLIIGACNFGTTYTSLCSSGSCHTLRIENSGSGEGLNAFSKSAAAIFAESCSNIGLWGIGGTIGVLAGAGVKGAIPFVARGDSCQTANLQEWRNVSCLALLAVDPSGNLLVDSAGTNNGSPTCNKGMYPGIQFGTVPGSLISGEGISSNRTGSSLGDHFGLDFWTGFLKRMTITNSGNVGIGTVTPSSTLDVNGNHHVSGSLSIGSNNAATGPDIYVGIAKCGLANTCNNSVFVANNSGCSTNQFRVDAFQNVLSVIAHSSPGAKSGAALSFRTALAGGGETNRVFITPGGDVGVNTCSPVTTLDVNGTIHTPKIGVGTTAPKTTLQVNGSIAAKILPKSASYSMVASDFGILASGTGTTITLPGAKTAAGMLVFIKNVNTTSIAVTVKPSGTDKIDGSSSSQSLATANSRLTLVSDGVSNWYIVANS
jgi:hypothetical protein